MGSKWRFIDSGPGDPAVNMAVDETLLNNCIGHPSTLPVFRTYNWSPPAISLGYSQDPATCLDCERCRSDGVEVVRRLTGGRAVYHDSEITCSLVVHADRSELRTVLGSFRYFSGGFLAALEDLGIHAGIRRAAPRPPRGGEKGVVCFDGVSRYEIVADGRKILGSAQRRRGGVILQQGAILFEDNERKLRPYLRHADSGGSEHASRRGRTKRMPGGRPYGYDELRDALKRGFSKCLDIEFVEAALTAGEEREAEKLRAQRYSAPEWNRLP